MFPKLKEINMNLDPHYEVSKTNDGVSIQFNLIDKYQNPNHKKVKTNFSFSDYKNASN